jgi:hypothetical protein
MWRISHFLDKWITDGGEVFSLTYRLHFISQTDIPVFISVKGWVNSRVIARLGELGKLRKVAMTSSETQPVTFWLVA